VTTNGHCGGRLEFVNVDEDNALIVMINKNTQESLTMEECYPIWLEYQAYNYRWINAEEDELDDCSYM